MTTIVYRNGIMASDSLVTNANDVRMMQNDRKIRRLDIAAGDWWVVGMSGPCGWDHALLAWANRSIPEHQAGRSYEFFVSPDPDRSFTLIAVKAGDLLGKPRPVLWSSYASGWTDVGAPFIACGTGQEMALGALAFGASAVEAVRVAIELDTHSGGPVRSVDVRDLSEAVA